MILSKKYAKGKINITLSILSNSPPCPGIKLLKSFIPQCLFIADADKSPIWLITLKNIETPNMYR